MNRGKKYRPTECVTLVLPDRIYQLLQAYSTARRESQSSIVESALKDFLDIIEQCEPEARALARRLSRADDHH